jgi:four helix bundle protein
MAVLLFIRVMSIAELKKRTFRFGVETVCVVKDLAFSKSTQTLGNQLIRSATSVGANYRAACRAKSRADFISKLKIVEEECDETLYWLDVLIAANLLKSTVASNLAREGNEILSIVVTSIKTARQNGMTKYE